MHPTGSSDFSALPGSAAALRGTAGAPAGAAGDRLEPHLPLLFNLVGRAVDSIPLTVETLRRAVAEVEPSGEPADYRSRLVVAAARAARSAGRAPDGRAGFIDQALAQPELSDQRREAVEATRWIAEDEREVLSLWWLEVGRKVARRELAAGLGVSPVAATAAVQQIEARFEDARTVVRALGVTPRCLGLAGVLARWDGRPSDRCRRLIARHARDCAVCQDRTSDLIPADRLLRGFPLVPPPAWLVDRVTSPGAELVRVGPKPGGGGGWTRRPETRRRAMAGVRIVAAAVAGAALAASLLSYARGGDDPKPSTLTVGSERASASASVSASVPSPTATASATGSPTASANPSANPSARPRAAASPRPAPPLPSLLGRHSVRAATRPGAYIRAIGGKAVVTQVGPSNSDPAKLQATFTLVPGLADRTCYSFRDSTGRYLRHFQFRVRVDANDGSAIFLEDTTFCARAGAVAGSVAFRSHNYPDRLLHVRGDELGIDPEDGSTAYRSDTSFVVTVPWLNA
ncbi:AbfB domain-containing protein [Cryptosporangium phraense]|uniref:Alpha-L-arabinofuranosidase B arabinose-binding domain-containing protein n=1 Tax=Cryptosporangium phraense TaxID=2593070 RepID=A0A545AY97_9ACTN|nr:AbfB domain-containing protein [Cryptosporangium phraense]TQS46271.1 hypothetical protein FL583_02430 [Cryptosporangium phraense]